MNNFAKIVMIVLLLLGAILIGVVYHKKTERKMQPQTQTQAAYCTKLKAIRLLPAGDFEFTVDGGAKMHGWLRGGVSQEAKDEVIRLLNSAQAGRMVVLQSQGDVLIVDVFLTLNNKEVSLWDWLVQNKLSYQIPRQK